MSHRITADMGNTMEFVPFAVGVMYSLLAASGLILTVSVIVWRLFS